MMILPDLKKTIIAPATPQGKGALAVIRMSGPEAFRIFAAISSRRFSCPAHKQVSLVKIKAGKTVLDEAIVVFFKGPNSYSGEDTVEISCHGSAYIVREILNAAISCGAVSAGPGEFTFRAFLNGKLDLSEAEAVNALISSDSAASHHAAITQTEGFLSAMVSGLKDKSVTLLAEIEARLDDSDGLIPEADLNYFSDISEQIRKEVLSASESFKAGRHIKEGLKIVFAGAPNSGKSSLMNAFLGYDRAIVSPMAGTTRDTLESSIEIKGLKICLTDTAGLDSSAGDSIEAEGMSRALSALRNADIVLLLKDSSEPESKADKLAAGKVKDSICEGTKIIKVFTKSDLSKHKRKRNGIIVSSVTGEGIEELKNKITENYLSLSAESASAITSARHYEALSAAAKELKELSFLLKRRDSPLELAAEHLRAALNCFGLITGETAPDDVLAKIFSSFCVGK